MWVFVFIGFFDCSARFNDYSNFDELSINYNNNNKNVTLQKPPQFW